MLRKRKVTHSNGAEKVNLAYAGTDIDTQEPNGTSEGKKYRAFDPNSSEVRTCASSNSELCRLQFLIQER